MTQLSMFIVVLAALVIPITMARFKVTSMPTAVAEIVVGIVLGESGFNLVQQNSTLALLSEMGVILLMFLSGMEIDFSLFKSKPNDDDDQASPVKLASLAFGGILLVAAGLSFVLKFTGFFPDPLLAIILFSTTALGVVIATLKEKEILSKPMGQTILLTAVLGEVVPMFGLTVYATLNGGNASRLWLLVLLLLAALFLLYRFKQPFVWFNKITKATTQLDIRLAFFLIFTLVIIAEQVGAETILGSFLAGMVMKLLEPHESTAEKLTSIGYGFFIPIFFIMTGVKLNLRELFTNPRALMLIPILVVCFFLAKLVPILVYRTRFSSRNSVAGGFLTATTITLVLPTVQVAQNLKVISSTQAGTFILAAVLVCILAPTIFNSVYKLSKEDLIKQRVVLVGANMVTVPIAQQLSNEWYEVHVVTTAEKNYKTYNSEVKNLVLLPEITKASLAKAGLNDVDILAACYLNDEANFEFAQAALQSGIKRVIAFQNSRAVNNDRMDQLMAEGVEIFNAFNVETSVLRALIESPSVMQMLTDTETGLYEVRVVNHRFTGRQLMDLPFIDRITVSRIRRRNHWIDPHGSTVLEYNDRLIFTGKKEDVSAIRQQLRKAN